MQEIFEKIIERLKELGWVFAEYYPDGTEVNKRTRKSVAYDDVVEIVNKVAAEIKMGDVSDGYHTFNELYHHRAVLFAVICNTHKDMAWKSMLHDTGDMYDGMFIVGIETPEGQATYHYDIEPYWDMFKVKELPKAPKWDGHTPDEAIRRISLLDVPEINVGKNDGWIPCSSGKLPEEDKNSEYYDELYVTTKDGLVDWAIYRNRDKEWYIFNNEEETWDFVENDNILAWMAKPVPYKPKGE